MAILQPRPVHDPLEIKDEPIGIDLCLKIISSIKQIVDEPALVSEPKQIRESIKDLQMLPEPQYSTQHVPKDNALSDPTVEFYHPTPKDPSSFLKYALLKSWENGRLVRWRKWHDEQLKFLLEYEQTIARKQVFLTRLKSTHPWLNSDIPEATRRLRVHSDSILSSKSKTFKIETNETEKELAESSQLSRTEAISKLTASRELRRKSQEFEDIFNEPRTPKFAQINLSASQFLIEQRHKICVEMYEFIENARIFPEVMPLSKYNKLVSRYDALLDSFFMQ